MYFFKLAHKVLDQSMKNLRTLTIFIVIVLHAHISSVLNCCVIVGEGRDK